MKKTAFITGSIRGIGEATAFEFAKNGYSVILNGVHETERSGELLKNIKKISKNSDVYYFDVSNASEVEKNCANIIQKYKKIDVLVNNAGILRDRTFTKMTYEEWDAVIKTNLYGPFYVTKNILPVMKNNNFGRVINISSIIGVLGNFGQTNYSASKAGLIGFTKSIAKEVASFNITVNAICPGLVETNILKNVPKEYIDSLLQKIPVGRIAKSLEIAKLILFISSEDASYVNGSIIHINGGWY